MVFPSLITSSCRRTGEKKGRKKMAKIADQKRRNSMSTNNKVDGSDKVLVIVKSRIGINALG